MNFPEQDNQDYGTNQSRSQPSKTPMQIFVVYYLSEQNTWIWSLPTFFYENAQKHAASLDRPTQILTYDLSSAINISDEDRVEWKSKLTKRERKIRQPSHVPTTSRVRRVRRIVS